MEFRMRIDELFKVGEKIVFTGASQTNERAISKTQCAIKIDGRVVSQIEIGGEIMSGTGHRDLWISSSVNLDHDMIVKHEVWLVGK